MANKSIFQHTSFFTLDEMQKKRARDYAKSLDSSLIDTRDVLQNIAALTVSLDFWDNKIAVLTQFSACPDSVQMILQDELYFALYIFSARYRLDMTLGYGHAIENDIRKIEQCNDLMNTLKMVCQADIKSTLLTIGDDGINDALSNMSSFNERRLYWVWAGRGGVLGSIISLLPDDFFHKMQALNELDRLVPITGCLSWSLYYFRFCVKMGLLIRHTILGSADKNIPWQACLAAQWHLHKFSLLNDFFWASGNLACYFWLYGAADYYGGALTSALLLMDVLITIWAYWEEWVQSGKDLAQYRDDILMLVAINAPAYQINALKYAERQCKLNWDYKLYALYVEMMYAICLFVAFSLLYCFFLPVAWVPASTALVLGVTGTVLCFVLNSVCAAIKQGLEVCKSVELSNYTAQDYLIENQSDVELSLLESEWIYHQNMIAYKQASLLRTVMIDFLVPPIVFIAFVFMPLLIGLSVVSAGLALAVWSHNYVENNYKHDINGLPAFQSAATNPSDNAIRPIITQGFFGGMAKYLHDTRDVILLSQSQVGEPVDQVI